MRCNALRPAFNAPLSLYAGVGPILATVSHLHAAGILQARTATFPRGHATPNPHRLADRRTPYTPATDGNGPVSAFPIRDSGLLHPTTGETLFYIVH
jgi:hypothetical protein